MKHAVELGFPWAARSVRPADVPPPGHRAHEIMDVIERRLADWAPASRIALGIRRSWRASTPRHAPIAPGPGRPPLMARAVLQRDEGDGWRLPCPRS